ncbi:AAA domain-containing protein [Micromonospora sp. WMMD980]|uniref:caspase, EACC1-associated type n=1 Tax=Micromonospora sp. WMMD980 TaxID=3016088 RepID=UPI002416BD91|nr:AAA domain-containing protein [Micromonospora sp. WMMD980]MDG4803398.1 AAA domain-containing protein [Micromonospora sp. WMMD980]
MLATGRKALLIGVERYEDGRFAALPSCRADVSAMHQVLRHPAIGSFDMVTALPDPSAAEMRRGIYEFLEDAGPGDLVLLYISGHGTRLRHSSGEFFFVARDTDHDRLEETAVSASFVNEQLEACRAPQKVTIIDACESGGFAVGLRTRDAKGSSSEQAPLQSRGVYVLSSSGVGEASYSGPTTDAGPQPSVFTGEIVRALQDGEADHDGDGKISVVDLFHHVSARVRSQERGSRQVPVYSAIGVNSKIVIADVIAGGAVRLDAAPTDPVARPSPTARKNPVQPPTWERLLDYYQRCLQVETQETPLLRIGEVGDRFVCLPGRERFLSGGSADSDQLILDAETAAWVRRVAESDDELWAGYPAVLLYGPPDRPWREPRFAPLVVRRVEIVADATGLRLEPVGPAQPHRGLAREHLGPDQARHLAETYYASWHAGGYAQMAKDMRELLRGEFELPMVEELRPEHLAATIDQRTPTAGARNVAVLYRVSRREEAVANLMKDLAHLRGRTADFGGTALAGLWSPEPADVPGSSGEPPLLAAPLACNEAQQEVIVSALMARLTVATGPPGSGKSQLVANAVATAVLHNQKVLVASTNNTAVDEVWRRCQELVPGLLVRTGSRAGQINYAENETTELIELAGVGPADRNRATARMALVEEAHRVARIRARLADVADRERVLLGLAQDRDQLAAALGRPVDDLAEDLGDVSDLLRWQRRARRCADARILARWRRTRLLRTAQLSGEPSAETCQALADFADAQQRWLELRSTDREMRDDATLAAEVAAAEVALHTASLAAIDTTVRSNARNGRQQILALLQAKQAAGSDWPEVKRALSAVRGWAVSSLAVRRFPTEAALFDLVVIDEASQCSIPQILPLLFRARRALVIGDPMQLRHIAAITPDREAEARRTAGLAGDWLDQRHLAYRRHSAFHALEHAAGGSRLLDEHYRCHPQIAEVVNRLFYGGQLTVLTDTKNRRGLDRGPIMWAPVQGEPRRPRNGGSWVNLLEAEKVNDCVRYLLQQLPDEATVGVVTPYKAQADQIARQWIDEPRVRVGTVHTFQGGERDVIVLSLVAGASMPGGSVAWLEAERNLWNVAISRARAHLIVVGDRAFWTSRQGAGAELAAVNAAADGPAADDDPLLQRLYARLSGIPGASVELAVTVHGHPCDALVKIDGDSKAVLLDRPAPTIDPARHLRLQYRRLELLTPPHNAVRLPAWQLYDTASSLLTPGPPEVSTV